MQDDGKTDGPWTIEITRVCVQCGGSGSDPNAVGTEPGHPTECPACNHGKEHRTLTIDELRNLLAQAPSE